MEALQGSVEPFVVAGQAAEARSPGEGAFHDPAAGQQHEAALGQGMLDHLQLDAVLPGGNGRGRASVALVYVGQLDRIPGRLPVTARPRQRPVRGRPGRRG